MKKVLLFFVTFILIAKALSQTVDDGLLKNDNCFLAVTVPHRAGVASTSKTFCVGDRITVKLKDNKIIQGRISKFSKNNIAVAGSEIDVSQIKWLKKSKLTASRTIVGGLLTVAGVAIFLPVGRGEVNFDQIVPQGAIGILLVTAGIVTLSSRTKFQIAKGDKLIFNDQN